MRIGRPRSKRAARKGERFIADFAFPSHLFGRIRKRFPEVDESDWELVERGLREWFVCCAWRGRAVLGMPSRAVDEAWHEFILDSIAYTDFCERAFGGYLHHTPDEAMDTFMGELLAETVRAWDRSEAGQKRDSILWDLDKRLGLSAPLGLDGMQLGAARSRAHYSGSSSATYGTGAYFGGMGDGGGYDGGGGDSGGGGGCGGGCGGGS